MATMAYMHFHGLPPLPPRNLNDSPKPTMQTAAPDRPGELLAWAASCTGVHGVGGVKKSGRPFWKPTRSSNFYVRKFREGGVPRVHDGACGAGPPDLDQAQRLAQ